MGTTETDANGTTYYYDVNGGKALAFKPKGMSESDRKTVLVFFHGYNSTSDLKSYMASDPPNRDLRPLLVGKPMLLVEPWGGQKSEFSKFVTASGLTSLIDEALYVSGVKSSYVILAAHSGGGMQLPLAAESSFDYADQLTQVWALDCMYLFEGTRWISWCRKNPGKALRVRASTHAPSAKPRHEAEVIAKAADAGTLSNANVDVVNRAHDTFPPTYVEAFSKFHYATGGRASMIEQPRVEQQLP